MKKIATILLAASAFGVVLSGMCGAQRGDGQWQGRNVIKRRHISVSAPDRFQNQSEIVNDDRQIAQPEKFESGEAIHLRPAAIPPQSHNVVMGNRDILKDISAHRADETNPNKFYWHEVGGMKYAHFYDDHGVHWYGFYHGTNFYWTRYYSGRWWWFDPAFTRWTFWWDGYWWWPGPTGYFVYVNDNYYPYQSGAVTVVNTETMPAPVAEPAAAADKTFKSPDGRRLVKVLGKDAEAFVYDTTGSVQVYLNYLGRGVDKIRFSGRRPGETMQILTDFQDGSFALFDMDGNPAKSTEPPAVQAPPAGESLPPLPAAAPGK